MPDITWPSSNEFDIPDLLPHVQPIGPELPIAAWGSVNRKNSFHGTVHFYVDDYRFSAIWSNPDTLAEVGANGAIEPNFSVFDQSTFPVALWATYRKRWLARYWQEQGIPVWVDLNVSETHSELNLLGVPMGWTRYATRGYDSRIADLHREIGVARSHAAGAPFMVLVYGGGKAVREAVAGIGEAVHAADDTAPRKWTRRG